MIPIGLTGGGTLYVQDDLRTRIHVFRRNEVTGLYQDFVVTIAKRAYEWENGLLCQRLAAGDLHQIAAEILELHQDLIDVHFLPAGERIFAVAPDATHRAARQTHERTRPSGMR